MPLNDKSEYRAQDRWEDNFLSAVAFDFDSFDDCPLLRGDLGKIVKSSISQQILAAAMQISKHLMALPEDEVSAFIMHREGFSDREIAERLGGVCHKTAKRKYERVFTSFSDSTPAGHGTSEEKQQNRSQ